MPRRLANGVEGGRFAKSMDEICRSEGRRPTPLPASHREEHARLYALGQCKIAEAHLLAAGDLVGGQTLCLFGPLVAQARATTQ